MACVFCGIIEKKISSLVIAENDLVIVIKDLHPVAPVHYLIIPKIHISDIGDMDSKFHYEIAAAIILMASQLSKIDLDHRFFKLISNNGIAMGQTIMHTHMHFIAGKKIDSLV